MEKLGSPVLTVSTCPLKKTVHFAKKQWNITDKMKNLNLSEIFKQNREKLEIGLEHAVYHQQQCVDTHSLYFFNNNSIDWDQLEV